MTLRKLPAAALKRYMSSISATRVFSCSGVSDGATVKLIKLKPIFSAILCCACAEETPDKKIKTNKIKNKILRDIQTSPCF
ncbi:MAG: hypothetical protein ACD_47C00086G0002, partial [uncultured bacterium]